MVSGGRRPAGSRVKDLGEADDGASDPEEPNAALQRELDAVYVELEKANAVIVEQGRKLAAHSEVAELEKRLQIARRSAS